MTPPPQISRNYGPIPMRSLKILINKSPDFDDPPKPAPSPPLLPKLSPEEEKQRAARSFAKDISYALEWANSPLELSLPLSLDKIESYQAQESDRMERIKEGTDRIIPDGAVLGIPASLREAIIKNIYTHAFYQATRNLERVIKTKMLDSAVDPDGLLTFDKDGLQLHWAGVSLRLNSLEEAARHGGLKDEEIAAELKRLHHEFKKANALLLIADVNLGLLNQYDYQIPCKFSEQLTPLKCRTWKEMLQPENWREDFIAPMERSALRYIYIF